jgi:hypothetical protein
MISIRQSRQAFRNPERCFKKDHVAGNADCSGKINQLSTFLITHLVEVAGTKGGGRSQSRNNGALRVVLTSGKIEVTIKGKEKRK